MKFSFLLLICFIIVIAYKVATYEPVERETFWYPSKLIELECDGHKRHIYQMTNSTGWRSWPYYLDPERKLEIESIGNACIVTVLKRFKTDIKTVEALTPEQQPYVIQGFN